MILPYFGDRRNLTTTIKTKGHWHKRTCWAWHNVVLLFVFFLRTQLYTFVALGWGATFSVFRSSESFEVFVLFDMAVKSKTFYAVAFVICSFTSALLSHLVLSPGYHAYHGLLRVPAGNIFLLYRNLSTIESYQYFESHFIHCLRHGKISTMLKSWTYS